MYTQLSSTNILFPLLMSGITNLAEKNDMLPFVTLHFSVWEYAINNLDTGSCLGHVQDTLFTYAVWDPFTLINFIYNKHNTVNTRL